jgi:hypothetical protein
MSHDVTPTTADLLPNEHMTTNTEIDGSANCEKRRLHTTTGKVNA